MAITPLAIEDGKEAQHVGLEARVEPSPLLSIVVPVYNGDSKIEAMLARLKLHIEKLGPMVGNLDEQEKQRSPLVNSGRKLVENASAAMILDQYLSLHPSDALASGLLEIAKGDTGQDGPTGASDQPWYEIIVVNDGSKDSTKSVLEGISAIDATIRLISYSINMGKGYAVRQGVLHSRGKYVMFLDGDGEISSEVLAKYMERMTSADIVIGSKYHPESVVRTPGLRRFFSKGFQLFVRLMLKTGVSDTQVGLKVGKGDAFRKIFQKVLVKRYAFDAEMLTVAGMLDLKVDELPVNIELEKSFKKKEIIRMAIDVLGIAFRSRIIKWYQKNMENQRPYYSPLAFV
jgi:dolichol-phosphate mannosyltransferase